MYCSNCGALVDESENYCASCGAQKNSNTPRGSKSGTSNKEAYKLNSINKNIPLLTAGLSRKTKVALFVLVALIFILMIILYGDQSSSPDPSILNRTVISAAIGFFLYALMGASLIRLVKSFKLGWRHLSKTACWTIPLIFILGLLAIYVPRAIQAGAIKTYTRTSSATQKPLVEDEVRSIMADPARLANELNKHTPLMRGDGQRIDKVSYEGKALYFYVTLTSYRANEINPDALYSEYKPILTRAACSEDTTTQLLKSGHVVDYHFSGNDGIAVNDVPITPQDCDSQAALSKSQ